MNKAAGSNSLKMAAMLLLGIALGLAAGPRLFGPAESESIPSAPEPGILIDRNGRSEHEAGVPQSARTPGPPAHRARRETPAAAAPSTLEVSTAGLAGIQVRAFAPRRGNPWTQGGSRFELTSEVRDLLGIDEATAEAVRHVYEQAHHQAMNAAWQEPARVEAVENGVAITIAPSASEARDRISTGLRDHLDAHKADLLMQYSAETLDWEFGGFGRMERVLEITVLADDSLAIRESLRPLFGNEPATTAEPEHRVNQYRIRDIPAELKRFVQLDPSP